MDDFVQREVKKDLAMLRGLDRRSLAERKESRDGYAKILKDPEQLDIVLRDFFSFSYGEGARFLLEQVLKNPHKRTNKVAQISAMVAGFECKCPNRYAKDAYVLQLTQPERDAANELFKRYIKEWEEEQNVDA